MKGKKILIILPYFGRFNNYFQLFLNSCAANPTIHWQLITDQDTSALGLKIPQNVYVDKCTFTNVHDKIKSLYGSEITTAYQLCKYKVVYSEIFDNRVRHYDFWGFCDCDLIFGNLRSFITDDVLNRYDKISWRGHLTLFRNTAEINSLYKLEIPGYKTFKGCIYETDGINLFDEVGINKIFDHEGKKIYTDLPLCDLRIRDNNFICQHELFDEKTNVNQIFKWSINGGLQRIFVVDGQLFKQSVAYVHFLKRPMGVESHEIFEADSYLIVPNKFIPYRDVTAQDVLKYSKKKFYWSYYKERLTISFLINKIKYKLSTQSLEADRYERPRK